jgi:DnaJ like chaperone protein
MDFLDAVMLRRGNGVRCGAGSISPTEVKNPFMRTPKPAKNCDAMGGAGFLRASLDALLAMVGLDRTPAHRRASFTIAFVALAAKMAKADGRVSPIESQTFERLYEVAPAEAVNIRRLFALASEDSAGFESYAKRIGKALAEEPRLLRDVYDGLFHIAAADGILHPNEDGFLRTVAEIFGISSVEFRSIRAAFVVETARGSRASDSPYDVLGIDPALTDAALKARYRELVRDHHPDSLTARGVPSEFHGAADRKLAVINQAYDAVLKQRGLKVSVSFAVGNSD